MENRIREIFAERGIKVSAFARDNDITPSTLYAIHDGTTSFEKIGIRTFMKIASGLDMTVEELYYGSNVVYEVVSLEDLNQKALNDYYESMNEDGRKLAVESVKAMSGNADLRDVGE